ncbi:SIR2 family protein [Curtobacterium sp. RHCJP20]|uniref:SIR2 family protein n=1 Tax=Curtobacterium subtropicum TaxID=3055138 RepID=A0ABT7TDP9_9MICO|nr:SIR2 family protein [Curtobacterium subtropicum]MDM7887686.1 SIR2 family protein [Curtobacterium subtropicum]
MSDTSDTSDTSEASQRVGEPVASSSSTHAGITPAPPAVDAAPPVLLRGTDWAEADGMTSDFLRDVLQAETLVVLTGLGTSIGVKTTAGEAPTMPALLDAVKALPSFAAVETSLSVESKGDDTNAGNVESLLSEAILANTLRPSERWQAFIDAAERTVLAKCQFVLPNTPLPHHERLLRAVARRSPKLPRTQLFTTNYDMAFETAASTTRTMLVDGFSWSGTPTFDGSWFDIDFVRKLPGRTSVPEQNVVHLLKLHGSVDWDQHGSRVTRANGHPAQPVLIYPAQNKYQLSYRQPYQEMMARLQVALRQPSVGLLVIGYGFHDAHINAPIESAIRSNVNLKMAAVAPNLQTVEPDSIPAAMEQLIRAGDDRFALIAGTFEDAVTLLPTLEQGDDRDEHVERVALVMDER